MDVFLILQAIDDEINKLQEVRSLLANSSGPEAILARRGPGRPKKIAGASKPVQSKRTLSPEARKKIADAQRKRWAASKKATK